MSHASHRLVSCTGLDKISPSCLKLPHVVTRVLPQVGPAHGAPFSAVQDSENFHQQISVSSVV